MSNIVEGKLVATGLKFAIVISRWNSFITSKLLDGAMDALIRHGAEEKDITTVYVPGTFEIPLIAQKCAAKDFDAVVCLGALIRGGTPHFEYLAAEVTKGIAQVGMDSGKPVVYGVLTCDTVEQAIDRAGTKAGNKGAEAALAAVEMANVVRAI